MDVEGLISMPLYDIRCAVHGVQRDVYAQMPEAMRGELRCPAVVDPATGAECGLLEVGRDYGERHENSDNNHRPWWSDQLSPGADPVYVATREQAQHLMKERGVAHWEPGLEADGKRERKRIEETAERRVIDRTREDFHKRMWFTRTYGHAPQR